MTLIRPLRGLAAGAGVAALLLLSSRAQAQEYVRPPADLDRLVQELFAEPQSDDVPYEDLYETLLQYYQTPLNLNTASAEELRSLLLLREQQIASLLEHRKQYGSLLSIYELQSIPEFDLRTIYRVSPFVTVVNANPNAARGPLWQRVYKEDNNALFLRYERVLQDRKGYSEPTTSSTGTTSSRYLGSPDKLMLRYRVSHTRDFSFGFTAEKDAGEQLAWDPNKRRFGPDFLSAHMLLQERGRLKTLAIGDYQLQFGQGLVLSSGLQVGKGAETITTIRRSSLGVRAYSSVLESTFYRGAAATASLTKQIQATGFLSRKRVDANVQQAQDSLADFDEFSSGIVLTGFHRTASELANRKELQETIGGGNIGYQSTDGSLTVGLTAVNTHYDKAIQKRDEPYNAYEFQGKSNTIVGAHYGYARGNWNVFGETARSSSGGIGTVNGLLASLSSNVDASILYRYYARDFHTFYGLALSENTRNINESGLYLGLKVRPIARWELSAYYDQFSFPWLKYRVGAPSHGNDWLLRLTFQPTKTSTLYAQFRARTKPYDSDSDANRLTPDPEPTVRHSLLAYFNTEITPAFSMRTRVQGTRYREGTGPTSTGFLLAQDASVAIGRPLRLSARYALFDTDNFDTRQYAFEQDVLYAFSVPGLSGRGTRMYLLAEVRMNRHLTLWMRYATTRYRDVETVGSGLEEIQGAERSEVKAQLRYRL